MARPKKEPVEPYEKLDSRSIMNQINKHVKSKEIAMADSPIFRTSYLPIDVAPIDGGLDGGLAFGRITEIYGEFSTLKSYIGLKAIAAAQRRGQTAALIDTENAFDPAWAEHLGVDLSTLQIWPNREKQEDAEDFDITAESALDKAELFVRSGTDLLIFDSIAGLVPKEEQGKSLANDKAGIALLARVLSRSLPKIISANRGTTILFLNQLRTAGIGSFFTYLTTTGGKAVPFYAATRVKITKRDKITETVKVWDGEKMIDTVQQVAQKYQMVVEKNKLNRPFRESWFLFDFNTGEVDEVGYLIGQGLERGLITQPSKVAWQYGDYLKVNGKDNFKRELVDTGFIGQLKEDIKNGVEGTVGDADETTGGADIGEEGSQEDRGETS